MTVPARQPGSRRKALRCTLPCTLMRAGTSKGVFIHRRDLPGTDASAWGPHLISVLGSRGNDPRQIDGVGGGSSTTSKVAVVAPSSRPDADVEFTFVQVAVGKEAVDLTGTCGNISSGVGPFALQEGIVKPQPGQTEMDIRVYNTNTDRIIVETVELDEHGDFEEDGSYTIAGVNNPGSEVKCAFLDPKGSMTGKLFPTGKTQEVLQVQAPAYSLLPDPVGEIDVGVTLIDGANPFVLIDSTSISSILQTLPSQAAQHELVESIRRQAAITMGLASSIEEASKTRGTPKVAIVYPPLVSSTDSNGPTPDIRIMAYSMGLPHPSLQLTGAVTIATALCTPGTVVAELSAEPILDDRAPPTPPRDSPTKEEEEPSFEHKSRRVVIAHSKGNIEVDVLLGTDGQVSSCSVSRTARRLFEGSVRYYISDSEV